MSEEKENWERIKKTGKVEDYLKYKKSAEEIKSTNNPLWKDVKMRTVKTSGIVIRRK